MGDAVPVEEILAEPEDPGFIQGVLGGILSTLTSNGWLIVGLGALTYYLYQRQFQGSSSSSGIRLGSGRALQTPEEREAQQNRDQARREAVLKLQEKYRKEAEERAEKLKQLEEQKKKERLQELERLEAIRGGRRLGEDQRKSFRPEYNPLMGDTSNSSRVCSRPSTGRGGG